MARTVVNEDQQLAGDLRETAAHPDAAVRRVMIDAGEAFVRSQGHRQARIVEEVRAVTDGERGEGERGDDRTAARRETGDAFERRHRQQDAEAGDGSDVVREEERVEIIG